jgi:glycerol uptake facilitator-like aquaporin
VTLGRKLGAEFLGTAFLLAAVVGSGIMGDRLSGGNVAIALLANSAATGAALAALILTFGPVSGAHFNPAVTLTALLGRALPVRDAAAYVIVQICGALFGVAVAHTMFGEPTFSSSVHDRSGLAQAFSEFVATFGLLLVIAGVSRTRSTAVPYAVASYIAGAYWFTASTSFANPAVTLARSMTNTFSGIRSIDVPLFLLAQLLAVLAIAVVARWLFVTPLPSTTPGATNAHLQERS